VFKRTITYTNFDDEEVSEVFYFNISKPELLDMEVKFKQGMSKRIQTMIDSNDRKELLETFKELVLLSYGEKSEDGRRFIKSDQISKEFTQTAAYDALFMELATSDVALVAFLNGILPKDMQGSITIEEVREKAKAQTTTTGASAPPLPPGRKDI
jgi:hypothetical protein